jgi:hypothetical protein
MESVSSKFILTFTTNSGVKDTYVIPRANADLPQEDVAGLMDDIIATACFATKKGQPVAIVSAERVTTTVEDLQ